MQQKLSKAQKSVLYKRTENGEKRRTVEELKDIATKHLHALEAIIASATEVIHTSVETTGQRYGALSPSQYAASVFSRPMQVSRSASSGSAPAPASSSASTLPHSTSNVSSDALSPTNIWDTLGVSYVLSDAFSAPEEESSYVNDLSELNTLIHTNSQTDDQGELSGILGDLKLEIKLLNEFEGKAPYNLVNAILAARDEIKKIDRLKLKIEDPSAYYPEQADRHGIARPRSP